MKTLMLIPSYVKHDTEVAVESDRHPRMDYHALAKVLSERPCDTADILDYRSVDNCRHLLVRIAAKLAGQDSALATLGFLRSGRYDAIFSNGENVALPLALLFKGWRRRPAHITIGHRLSAGKKKLLYTHLKLHRQMDRIFVYASVQRDYACRTLGIPAASLTMIPFHADHKFYRSRPADIVCDEQVCSAGLEWRDYPTLIEAVDEMSSLRVKLAAASPWSKHVNETERMALPSHIDARPYEYAALRDLYAQSALVVVPLRETDFQAGITTILEAMAMGRPVIATRTTGQTDVIVDGVTGLSVSPGDAKGLREAITRLIQDPAQRERLGSAGRQWLEENATLDLWAQRVADGIRSAAFPVGHGEGLRPRVLASSEAVITEDDCEKNDRLALQ